MQRTVSPQSAVEIADQINADFKAGKITTANGHELVSRFGQPVATSWGTGSVSVTVKAKAKGKTNEVYFKHGRVVTTA